MKKNVFHPSDASWELGESAYRLEGAVYQEIGSEIWNAHAQKDALLEKHGLGTCAVSIPVQSPSQRCEPYQCEAERTVAVGGWVAEL